MERNVFGRLKRETQETQKKGLPFILASVLIWSVVSLIQLTELSIGAKNLFVFCCSALLLPLSLLFSKMIHADTFKKSTNPLDQLGFICTMNQLPYLLIVMWAYNQKPEAMLMLFAMVFGAHLLPFGWLYDSKAYVIASIVETIGVLIIALALGNFVAGVFMAASELMLTAALFWEVKKSK